MQIIRSMTLVATKLMLTATLFVIATPSKADLIHNNGTLFDSQSGLSWQIQQIPLSTFTPLSGAIATSDQLNVLISHSGITGWNGNESVVPYTSSVQSLLAFFAPFSKPAYAPEGMPAQSSFTSIYKPISSDPVYEYMYFYYRVDSPSSPSALYLQLMTTIGSYGPLRPCPTENSIGCPATNAALVVLPASPVPLPSAAWLLFSGLAALSSRFAKRN